MIFKRCITTTITDLVGECIILMEKRLFFNFFWCCSILVMFLDAYTYCQFGTTFLISLMEEIKNFFLELQYLSCITTKTTSNYSSSQKNQTNVWILIFHTNLNWSCHRHTIQNRSNNSSSLINSLTSKRPNMILNTN